MATAVSRQNGKEAAYEFDPQAAVKYLRKVDPTLARLMQIAGPFKMEIRALHSPFEALSRNIVYQQLHGTAAAAILARVVTLFGGGKLRPTAILDASTEDLRRAGPSY